MLLKLKNFVRVRYWLPNNIISKLICKTISSINIWAHGSIDKKSIILNGNKVTSAEDFKEFLDKNSSLWNVRKDKDPITIVLHSCSLSEFAKKISSNEHFQNITIIGATDPISVLVNRKTYAYLGSSVDNKGAWKSYKNGKEIVNQSYGSNDQPGSIYPKIKTNLIKVLVNNLKVSKSWQK